MSKQDFIYENAPLIEVIAEVRWVLIPLRAIPGAQVDPHFGAFTQEFARAVKLGGYIFDEMIIPPNVPLELFAGQPVRRFRRKPGGWPLFQIGPGLLTANIVPPYKGWAIFREVLSEGLSLLFDAYPLASQYLHINRMELRYIDAFVREHGYDPSGDFLASNLGIEVRMPDGIVLDSARSSYTNIEIFLQTNRPENSTGILKFVRGFKNDNDALIGELVIRQEKILENAEIKFIKTWFDEAHEMLGIWFDVMAKDQLKERMGPKRYIGAD